MNSIYSGIAHNTCTTCSQPCTSGTISSTTCKCSEPMPCTSCNTCNTCSGGCFIPINTIVSTECGAIPCNEGCQTTILASCVVLNDYCFINDCNCANKPITLDLWIKQICLEITNIKLDIECLKTHIPSCTTQPTCSTPIMTNISF